MVTRPMTTTTMMIVAMTTVMMMTMVVIAMMMIRPTMMIAREDSFYDGYDIKDAVDYDNQFLIKIYFNLTTTMIVTKIPMVNMTKEVSIVMMKNKL
jgi:hypothetical protein